LIPNEYDSYFIFLQRKAELLGWKGSDSFEVFDKKFLKPGNDIFIL